MATSAEVVSAPVTRRRLRERHTRTPPARRFSRPAMLETARLNTPGREPGAVTGAAWFSALESDGEDGAAWVNAAFAETSATGGEFLCGGRFFGVKGFLGAPNFGITRPSGRR